MPLVTITAEVTPVAETIIALRLHILEYMVVLTNRIGY